MIDWWGILIKCLVIIPATLFGVFLLSYICAVVYFEYSLKNIRKPIQNISNPLQKQSNYSNEGGKQGNVVKRIIQYIKYFPKAIYRFYWQEGLVSKNKKYQGNNECKKCITDTSPKPVSVELPDSFHTRIINRLLAKCKQKRVPK
jgi:hypothetical protein